MLKKLLLIVFVLALNIPIFADVEFTDEEIDWLKDHDIITYAGDSSWPPIDFKENNQHSGLINDYLNELEYILNIRFKKVYVGTWEETLESIEGKEIDLIAAAYNDERSDYLSFTDTIIDIPSIIITRQDYPHNIEIPDLNQYTVATIEGWALNDILRRDHPGITLEVYPSVEDAIKAVSFGTVDCMIQDVASVSYIIQSNKITNLRDAGSYSRNLDIRFAVRKDYEILTTILNKALNQISSDSKKAIYNRWISIQKKPFYKTLEFLNIILVLLFFIIVIFAWIKTMQKQINTKTKALREELSNREKMQQQLENTMNNIVDMQHEMVRQERLASLGSMVAGISHEVNNPLGICLTTATAFSDHNKKIKEAYQNNNLSKKQFQQYLDFSEETSKMLTTNIENAINIIKGFRSMAVNQMHDEPISINICEYLNTIKDSLKYELKKKKVILNISCMNEIVLNLYAGAFTQIFTNLILNSIIHGFNYEQENIITITARISGDELIIEYRDNGRGISPENVSKIFDMFFTTKREEGGSGLGLHIVKNILEEKFNGRITCDSKPDEGVLFIISIPIVEAS